MGMGSFGGIATSRGVRSPDGNYSDDFIEGRIGNEDRRKREIDAAAQSGNLAELQRLTQESATADGKNYASLLLSRLTGVAPVYRQPNDGSGLQENIGRVVQQAAPLAAFIPGVGPLAAGAIAAGASAGGQGLQGEPINLGKAALTGVGTYVGAKALGGASGAGGKSLTGLSKAGDAVSQGGVGGTLSRLGGGVVDFITQDPERAIKLGLGGIGAYQASQAAGRANDLQQRALAPLFGNSPNPYANIAMDEGNPYSRQRPRTGQQVLRGELSR